MAYQANACGMVPDVGFISPLTPLPIGIGRDGCYTRRLQMGSARSWSYADMS
jgi:hypothetical protein